MSKVRGSACGRTSTVKAGSNTTDAENSWLSVQQRVGKFCRLICAVITCEGLSHHFKHFKYGELSMRNLLKHLICEIHKPPGYYYPFYSLFSLLFETKNRMA